jgi:hypothetical protein
MLLVVDSQNARENNLHHYHQQLTALVGPQEATSLLVQAIWTPEDMGKDAMPKYDEKTH